MEKGKHFTASALAVLAGLSLSTESEAQSRIDPIITQTMELIGLHARSEQEKHMVNKHIAGHRADIERMKAQGQPLEMVQKRERYVQLVQNNQQMQRKVIEHNPVNLFCVDFGVDERTGVVDRRIGWGGNLSSHSGILRMFEVNVSNPGLVTITETIRKQVETKIQVTRRTKTWTRAEFKGANWFRDMDKIKDKPFDLATMELSKRERLELDIKHIANNCR